MREAAEAGYDFFDEDRTLSLDSSPTAIRKSIEGSLRRLGTDYVDLYYQHRIDPKVEPEVMAATMKELIPGSRKLSRLKENLAASDVELTADEVARIDTDLDGMDFEVFGSYAAR